MDEKNFQQWQAPKVGFTSLFRFEEANFLKIFKYCSTFGDVVRLPSRQPIYLVNHPDSIKHILHLNADNYIKNNTAYNLVTELLGPGLLTSSGESWANDRALLQPLFHSKSLGQYLSLIQKEASASISSWQDNKVLNIGHELMLLQMKLSARVFLGIEFTQAQAEILLKKINQCNAVIASGQRMHRYSLLPSHWRF